MNTLTPAIHADIIPNANIGDYFRIDFQPIAKIIDKAFHAGCVLYKVLIGEECQTWRVPLPKQPAKPQALNTDKTDKAVVTTVNDECGNTITKVWWDDGRRLGGRYRNIPPGWRHSYLVPHEHNYATAEEAIKGGTFTFKTYLAEYLQGDYWVYCRLNRQQQEWIETAANQEQLIAA